MIWLMHSIPGRMRIKIPALYRRPRGGPKIKNLLEEIDGMDEAVVNIRTGGVILFYDPAILQPDQLLEILRAKGLGMPAPRPAPSTFKQRLASGIGERLGQMLFQCAIKQALQTSGLSFLAALI